VKKLSEFVVSRLVAGVLVVAPIYLAALLLLKLIKSLTAVVRPVHGELVNHAAMGVWYSRRQ